MSWVTDTKDGSKLLKEFQDAFDKYQENKHTYDKETNEDKWRDIVESYPQDLANLFASDRKLVTIDMRNHMYKQYRDLLLELVDKKVADYYKPHINTCMAANIGLVCSYYSTKSYIPWLQVRTNLNNSYSRKCCNDCTCMVYGDDRAADVLKQYYTKDIQMHLSFNECKSTKPAIYEFEKTPDGINYLIDIDTPELKNDGSASSLYFIECMLYRREL
jgi:hypothetical protein